MPARIKFSNRLQTFLTSCYSFWGKFITAEIGGISLSKLNHYFALFFFDNKIWFKVFTNKVARCLVANPLPHREVNAFIARYTSFDSFLASFRLRQIPAPRIMRTPDEFNPKPVRQRDTAQLQAIHTFRAGWQDHRRRSWRLGTEAAS